MNALHFTQNKQSIAHVAASPVSMSPVLTRAPSVSLRVSADEDGKAEAQHLHHQMLAVDHCDRANLPCGYT